MTEDAARADARGKAEALLKVAVLLVKDQDDKTGLTTECRVDSTDPDAPKVVCYIREYEPAEWLVWASVQVTKVPLYATVEEWLERS